MKSKKILVVDDDVLDRTAIAKLLSSYKLELFDNGLSGFQALLEQQDEISCVVVDYRLPDIDGLTFIERVKDAECQVPIVLSTGSGDESLAVKTVKSGADYVPKAMMFADLAQTVSAAIKKREKEKAAERKAQKVLNDLMELNKAIASFPQE